MSLDTSKYFLQFQILDLSRERIEDYVAELIQASGTVNKFYNDLADLLTLSGSGIERDGSTPLTGNWDYGPFTISGTGDIHCNDLYTSGSSVHIGDSVILSEYNNTDLQINSNIRWTGPTSYPTIDLTGNNPSTAMIFKLMGGNSFFKIQNSGGGERWNVGSNTGDTWQSGGATFGGDVLFGANTISGTGDIHCNDLYTSGSSVNIGDNVVLTDDGTGLDVNTQATIGGPNPRIEFSSSSGTVGVSGKSDLMELTASGVSVNGWLMAESVSLADGATGWFDDGVNFRITVTNGIITNIGTTVSGGYSMI